MKVLEDTHELFIRSGLHQEYQDTDSFILIADKYVFIYVIGCDWEPASEVGCYP